MSKVAFPFAQPTQEFRYLPILTTDGGERQTAFISPISSKFSNQVRKRNRLGFRNLQTPQEAKPFHCRLDEKLSRPPQAARMFPLLLLTGPLFGGCLNGR